MQKKIVISLIVLAVCCGVLGWRHAIPQELRNFAESYPEAAGFVRAYPIAHDKDFSIDLSGEVQSGDIPLLLQWDKRWGYVPYGDGWIGNSGCGPTSLSMVVIGLTGETQWDPRRIAAFSEEHGWYEPGVGTSWDLLTEGAGLLGIHAETGTISADYIRENLSPETPMIASMRPGDFTKGGHLLVLRGLDENGNVLVNDPNSPKRSSRAWSIDVLLPQIKGLWRYSQ